MHQLDVPMGAELFVQLTDLPPHIPMAIIPKDFLIFQKRNWMKKSKSF